MAQAIGGSRIFGKLHEALVHYHKLEASEPASSRQVPAMNGRFSPDLSNSWYVGNRKLNTISLWRFQLSGLRF